MMKALLVLAMTLVGFNAYAGIEQLPVNDNGEMVYGEASSVKGYYNYLGRGRVGIQCSGKFFPKPSENKEFVAYVAGDSNGIVTWMKYSAEAGSVSCAEAKAIVACATENDLTYCEENVVSRQW